MVSLSVSPFEELVVEASEKPMILPPKRFTAVSKLSRVRVDGSKKKGCDYFSFQNFPVGIFFKTPGFFQQVQDLFF